MAFAEQLLQGIESHRWHADGVRVENFHQIHDVGILEEIQKIYEKYTV